MLPGGVRTFLAAAWGCASLLAAADSRILVLASASGEAFTQALEGLRENGRAVETIDLSRDPVPSANPGAILVALGSQAAGVAASWQPPPPVIVTLVLEADLAPARQGLPRVVSRVFLDVPWDALLTQLQEHFPGKTRLGWIRNSNRAGPRPEPLQARSRERGFTLAVAECTGPESLLNALRSLKDRADLVWCEPDSTLYNAATVKPLILASLELRLPIIGFSESFVRAGAALGVYPDFRDIGRQAGELAARYSAGQGVPARESPRKIRMAVNERMARLLGLRYATPASGAGFLVVR